MASTPGADILRQLLDLRWRNVSVPYTTMTMEFRHDLVEHKTPDQDGAHVEATGRAPIQFTAQLPFLNNIKAAPNEQWGGHVLYPDVFRDFERAMEDKSSGELQHPEFGIILCRPVHFKMSLAPAPRDGCWVEASWIETLSPTEQKADTTKPSPVTGAIAHALELDEQLAKPSVPLPKRDEFKPTFEDDIRALQAVTDRISVMQRKYVGKIDQIAYRLRALSESIDRASTPLSHPLRQSAERMQTSLVALKDSLLRDGRKVRYYIVRQEMTLAAIALVLHKSVGELLDLNPELARKPTVPELTVVKYYRTS
jgi:hypothetical protein